MASDNPDFKAIAGNAKKSDAYRKMAGPDESDVEGAGGSDEDASLGEAYAATQSDDEDGFKAAMAAAMRACYRAEAGKKK